MLPAEMRPRALKNSLSLKKANFFWLLTNTLDTGQMTVIDLRDDFVQILIGSCNFGSCYLHSLPAVGEIN